MGIICNVDIGGTHTDGAVIDEEGNITHGKVRSTPEDFSEGFFDVVEIMTKKRGLDIETLLDETELMCHGTTVGTNTILEGDESNTALITTRGAESTTSIMRAGMARSAGLRPEEYLHAQEATKPDPIVPRENIFGVNERMDSMGDVVVNFDEDQAREIVKEIRNKEVDSVAISFLWSFLNETHEMKMESLLEEGLDEDVSITRSSNLSPMWGEYERTTASVINADIAPSTSDYIERIDQQLTEYGFSGAFLVMQVGGGLYTANEAVQHPIHTIDSGPAAGITGCSYLGNLLDLSNIIAADMGGTSFDVGIIVRVYPEDATVGTA